MKYLVELNFAYCPNCDPDMEEVYVNEGVECPGCGGKLEELGADEDLLRDAIEDLNPWDFEECSSG